MSPPLLALVTILLNKEATLLLGCLVASYCNGAQAPWEQLINADEEEKADDGRRFTYRAAAADDAPPPPSSSSTSSGGGRGRKKGNSSSMSGHSREIHWDAPSLPTNHMSRFIEVRIYIFIFSMLLLLVLFTPPFFFRGHVITHSIFLPWLLFFL